MKENKTLAESISYQFIFSWKMNLREISLSDCFMKITLREKFKKLKSAPCEMQDLWFRKNEST